MIEPQEEELYRVLIVNDDEQISKFYVTLLQHAGMEAMALIVPMKVLDALSAFFSRSTRSHGPTYAQERRPRARCRYPAGGCLPLNTDCLSLSLKRS